MFSEMAEKCKGGNREYVAALWRNGGRSSSASEFHNFEELAVYHKRGSRLLDLLRGRDLLPFRGGRSH